MSSIFTNLLLAITHPAQLTAAFFIEKRLVMYTRWYKYTYDQKIPGVPMHFFAKAEVRKALFAEVGPLGPIEKCPSIKEAYDFITALDNCQTRAEPGVTFAVNGRGYAYHTTFISDTQMVFGKVQEWIKTIALIFKKADPH